MNQDRKAVTVKKGENLKKSENLKKAKEHNKHNELNDSNDPNKPIGEVAYMMAKEKRSPDYYKPTNTYALHTYANRDQHMIDFLNQSPDLKRLVNDIYIPTKVMYQRLNTTDRSMIVDGKFNGEEVYQNIFITHRERLFPGYIFPGNLENDLTIS